MTGSRPNRQSCRTDLYGSAIGIPVRSSTGRYERQQKSLLPSNKTKSANLPRLLIMVFGSLICLKRFRNLLKNCNPSDYELIKGPPTLAAFFYAKRRIVGPEHLQSSRCARTPASWAACFFSPSKNHTRCALRKTARRRW